MRVLCCLLCLLAFTFVSCSSQTISTVVAPSIETLSADELNVLVDSQEEIVFVDVRSTQEIERDGTIEGFVHIPIGEFGERYSEIPKGKKIVVACARGGRASRGASILQKNGYTDVVSVGLLEYKQKGYELIYPELAD